MSKITIDRSLLEQAIDALEKERPYLGPMPSKTSAAITALREALAQPQQEPVDALDNPRPVGEITWGGCVSWNGSIPEYGTDLYTSPPASTATSESVRLARG